MTQVGLLIVFGTNSVFKVGSLLMGLGRTLHDLMSHRILHESARHPHVQPSIEMMTLVCPQKRHI